MSSTYPLNLPTTLLLSNMSTSPAATPEQSHRLHCPHEGPTNDSIKVFCWIEKPIFNDLFHGWLAGCHGARSVLIRTFFKKLYNAIKSEYPDLPAHYDPDNESRIAKLVARLNFEDIAVLRHANNQPDRDAGTRADGGGVAGIRSDMSGETHVGTDASCSTKSRKRRVGEKGSRTQKRSIKSE